MAHRPVWRSIRINRSYTADEVARTLGVAKGTVRRWIAVEGLPIIDDRKPALILGRDLIAFGKRKRSEKQTCRLDQCFCMRCRKPKAAAFKQAELIPSKGASMMIRMLCETCTAVMHKRVSWSRMEALSLLVRLSAPHRLKHLIETTHPCVIVHFEKDD